MDDTFKTSLSERTERGREQTLKDAAAKAERDRLEEQRQGSLQASARGEWLHQNLPRIKAALGEAADRGENRLRLTGEALNCAGIDLDRPGCMRELAAGLAIALGVEVAGESDTQECNMGDSAAPCWTKVTTNSLVFVW